MKYSYGPYNKVKDTEQRIRLTEGCPHNCPYCYEPKEIKIFDIPEIVRNNVGIIDMNLLCKEEALGSIKKLGDIKVNDKVVYYECICGIDYRFLDQEIAEALKKSRFKNMRIAWDWWYADQFRLKKGLSYLTKAGFSPDDITIFMICNWKIDYVECCKKLDLCKVWNVKAADCYFDNQISPNIKPMGWSLREIRSFRKLVRKHNQLVNFKCDPEINREEYKQQRFL